MVNGFASNLFDAEVSGKRMGSARTGSNPVLVAFLFFLRQLYSEKDLTGLVVIIREFLDYNFFFLLSIA